ncbi:MAG: alcohol dehydrogenase catalytic domain-containing protein [Nitrospinota bacterium]|nr:alcohol dehydrogenase catalytic domain-containing protein [Nitrospinota bacterium]
MGAGGEPRLVTERPRPVISAGQALIRMTMAGICSTDLEIAKGYMDFSGVLGHEFVGVVEEVSDKSAPGEPVPGEPVPGKPAMVGKRVVGEINIPCRSCPACTARMGNHCPTRGVLGIVGVDGAFADHLTLPVENLHQVPDNVSDQAAVFTEPLAAAFRILEQADIRPGMKVAALGVGRLGQLVVQVLVAEGADVTAIGRSREKLELLKGVAATTALDTEVTCKALFDVVVDSTGAPEGLARAMELVRPCGTIILKTTVAAPARLDTNRLVIDEITVIGSRCGPFDKALRALAEGTVDPAPLVSATMSLGQAEEAMRIAAMPGAIKVLLHA